MKSNPFIRETLRSTAAEQVRPEDEVAYWLGQLAGVIEGQYDDRPGERAYEMLASRWALRRVRPELLENAGDDELLTEADERLGQRPAEWAANALTVPHPQAWLEQAVIFEMSLDEVLGASVVAERAQQLICDLDEADLVCAALADLGHGDMELVKDLEVCHAWLRDYADLFVDASGYIQSAAASLRPELAEESSLLARSVVKYRQLLDAIEAGEAAMTGEPAMEITPEVLRTVFQAYAERQSQEQDSVLAHISDWLPTARVPHLAAARGAEVPTVHWQGTWRSPSSEYVARLVIPASLRDGENHSLELTFYRETDGSPAAELAGTEIELAGVASVTEGPVARFRVGDLRRAGNEPDLVVRGVPWPRNG